MAERDWLDLELVEAPAAEREQLLRVHDERHLVSIEELTRRGGGLIDLDTVASAGSWEAALHAAGGAVHATERVLADGVMEPDRRGDPTSSPSFGRMPRRPGCPAPGV